jgi:hypothetical protein
MTTPRFPRLHHRFSVQQTEHSRSTSRNMAAGNLAALCVSIDDSNPIPVSSHSTPTPATRACLTSPSGELPGWS